MLRGTDKMKMQVWLLLSLVVLSNAGYLLVSGNMIPEDRLVRERHGNAMERPPAISLASDPPPVEILELPKAVKMRKAKRQRNQKTQSERRKKAPPPPPDCVPLRGGCMSPTSTCCGADSFCHCRLFKTVCYCRARF